MTGTEVGVLLDRIDLERVGRIADLGGTAQALVLAVWRRWDCEVVLVDIDPGGCFPEDESGWIAPYRAALAAQGVPAARIRVIRNAEDLLPCDLIVTLNGFGDVSKITHIGPVLDACLYRDSRLILDIRKGSGTYPYLRPWGRIETLIPPAEGEGQVTRGLLRPYPAREKSL